jgi:ABC-type uncharacterized transport system substrate-binding protein
MQFDRLKRRLFITLIGAAAAWPPAARAQPRASAMPVVGFLHFRSRADTSTAVAAFRQGLRETGFVEGQNVTVEYRFAENQAERLPTLAADLVQRRVLAIAAGPRAHDAVKAATATIPIVFLSGGDPVRTGLVASLNRPSGNLTGVTVLSVDLIAKRFGLLHDLISQAAVVGILVDSTQALSEGFQLQEVETAAHSIGRTTRVISADSERAIDAAFETFASERVGALMVAASSIFIHLRDRVVELAARLRIPAIYEMRDFAEAGGLMSYGSNNTDAYRQVGVYIGRILKGERPVDLPILLPTKFEFVINLKTAKALGLAVPDKLLALADEVIE